MLNKFLVDVFIFLIISALSSSCVFGPNGKLIHKDQKRTYSYHLPKGYKKAKDRQYPLLLLFHGNPSRGWQMARYTGMNKTANEAGFIVVYPDANQKKWAYKDQTKVLAEVDYVLGLLNDVQTKFRIDTTQIFAAGMSGGGIFTFNLADQIPGKLAGIAVLSGNMPEYLLNHIDKKPIPLLYIHGTDDFLYEGRDILISAKASLEYWKTRNQTNSTAIQNLMLDLNKKDESQVLKYYFESKVNALLVYYEIIGGGHHWPSARFNADKFTKLKLGNFNKDLKTNLAILNFFQSIKP